MAQYRFDAWESPIHILKLLSLDVGDWRCEGNEGRCVGTGRVSGVQYFENRYVKVVNVNIELSQLANPNISCIIDNIHTFKRPCCCRWWIGSHIYHVYCGAAAPPSPTPPNAPSGIG